MPEIRVDPGSLRSAGGTARLAGSQLRSLAGEVTSAVAGVGGAAPPETSAASSAFASALETCALAIAEGIAAVGSNAESAASVYEQVDRQAMPASAGGRGPWAGERPQGRQQHARRSDAERLVGYGGRLVRRDRCPGRRRRLVSRRHGRH